MIVSIALVGRDGIGAEILKSTKAVLIAVGKKYGHKFNFIEAPIGGEAIDFCGAPLPDEAVEICKSAGAVLLGAVGGYKWDNAPVRPEAALLGLRKALNLFSNLRPAKLYPELSECSPLKNSVENSLIDLVIVRELTGGSYFGERGFRNGEFGREAFDTERYSELEIERVARTAFELAQTRSKKLCSVDKANVLLSSRLWRKIVHDIHEDYPDVALNDMYVDNCAMQLVKNPKQFDIIVTSNMFGDILSDLSAGIVGSIGVMPSASLGDTNVGMYEAIHGSAPDIAGQNIANPIGTILSAALMLRHSFNLNKEAEAIEQAVESAIKDGARTKDIACGGEWLTTDAMTEKIIERLG